MPFGILLLLVAAAAADLLLAQEYYKAAVMKDWPQKKYYWYCLLTLPGWLLVAALPQRGQGTKDPLVSDELPKL